MQNQRTLGYRSMPSELKLSAKFLRRSGLSITSPKLIFVSNDFGFLRDLIAKAGFAD